MTKYLPPLIILGVAIAALSGCAESPYNAGYRNCEKVRTIAACDGYVAYDDSKGVHHGIKLDPAITGDAYWNSSPLYGK